jgi:hypothetical protein
MPYPGSMDMEIFSYLYPNRYKIHYRHITHEANNTSRTEYFTFPADFCP